MCGRFSCPASFEEVAEGVGVHRANRKGNGNGGEGGLPSSSSSSEKHRRQYNVCPGRSTPVLYRDEQSGSICLGMMKWGLVPSFTKKTAKPDYWRMFNARSESVETSPVFRRLLRRRRCIVPIQGFYEWKQLDTGTKRKQPYFVYLDKGQGQPQPQQQQQRREESLVFLAGLYDRWIKDTGEEEWTYSILTTQPCDEIAWLHNRMPVILDTKLNGSGVYSEDSFAWIKDLGDAEEETMAKQEKQEKQQKQQKQQHIPSAFFSNFFNITKIDGLRWHPVTSCMGNTQYNEADCCEDVRVKVAQEHKGSIQDLFRKSARDGGKQLKQKQNKEEEEEEEDTKKPLIGLKLQSSPTKRKRSTSKSESNQRSITSFFSK